MHLRDALRDSQNQFFDSSDSLAAQGHLGVTARSHRHDHRWIEVQAGAYSASIAQPRSGHAQTFEIELSNFSSVSQTVLGLTDGNELGNPRTSAEPVHLTVSANSEWPQTGPLHFTTAPVTLAPKSTHVARFTIDTGHQWKGCRSEYWDSLSLQVRVGIFTRTETVDFGSLIFELRSGGAGCWS